MGNVNLNQIDMHIHSTCSDGQYTITELLNMAKQYGLKYIGFVDHDTINNFYEIENNLTAQQMKKDGVRIFVGTEFSCKIDNYELHLISYNFNYKSDIIRDLIKHGEILRQQKLQDKLDKLKEYGIFLKEEQIKYLKSIKNVGKPHIARCLIENGVEGSMDSIIKKYLNGSRVYRLDASEVINAVHRAGGFMIIAHPYQIAEENHISLSEAENVWKMLINMGVDGMECYYSKYNEKQINYLVKFAQKHNLLITFGSDFHGEKIKPNVGFGCIKNPN